MARLLTLDETEKYLKLYREFADEDALTLLVTCNGGLVGFFAKKVSRKRINF